MTEHGCPECGFGELETRKTVEAKSSASADDGFADSLRETDEDNEVKEGGRYCPDCETDFVENAPLHWDEIDFPVWVEMESYNDNWELAEEFRWQTGLQKAEFDGSKTTDMKYCVFTVWFKVTENGSVEGPYDAKRGEKI